VKDGGGERDRNLVARVCVAFVATSLGHEPINGILESVKF
jgi:hypothetical protein